MRRGVDIEFRGQTVRAEFGVEGPDYSVGIMGYSPEDVTLHDAETEDMLSVDFHNSVTDAEWEQIDEKIIAAGGCEYTPEDDF